MSCVSPTPTSLVGRGPTFKEEEVRLKNSGEALSRLRGGPASAFSILPSYFPWLPLRKTPASSAAGGFYARQQRRQDDTGGAGKDVVSPIREGRRLGIDLHHGCTTAQGFEWQ